MCETLQFLDCICGSTTGGLGLLGLYINENNVDLVRQTLETITEYCQGPCHENQVGEMATYCPVLNTVSVYFCHAFLFFFVCLNIPECFCMW